MIKKITTILKLIKNVIFRRKYYTLSFYSKFDGLVHRRRWFYDFKNWGFEEGNLEMVAGADNLCTHYALGKSKVTVDIIASKKPISEEEAKKYDTYVAEDVSKFSMKDRILWGRNYTNIDKDEDGTVKITNMWICPVTLFVLGRYPRYIYIKKHGE